MRQSRINPRRFAETLFVIHLTRPTYKEVGVIKKYIIIAALLTVTACGNHTVTKKQAAPDSIKLESRSHQASPSPNLTQASSLSTADGENPSITMKQIPYDGTGWMDWVNRISQPVPQQYPVNPPVNQPVQQYPANPPASVPANPVAPANPAAPQPSADPSQYALQVLELVNKERSNAGLNPLAMDDNLTKVAMAKAQDMYNNNYFDHQSPTYGSPFDMMRAFGITYNSAGENIAKGQTSPAEVMNQWMNSPGHRANILNTSFTKIGIAFYNNEWVQEFTG